MKGTQYGRMGGLLPCLGFFKDSTALLQVTRYVTTNDVATIRATIVLKLCSLARVVAACQIWLVIYTYCLMISQLLTRLSLLARGFSRVSYACPEELLTKPAFLQTPDGKLDPG